MSTFFGAKLFTNFKEFAKDFWRLRFWISEGELLKLSGQLQETSGELLKLSGELQEIASCELGAL